jgi:hypothetical protein
MGRNERLKVVAGAAGVAVVIAGLILLGGRDDTGPVADDVPVAVDIVVEGDRLPAYDRQLAVDPAVGMRLPTITGVTPDGATVTIDPADGRPKLILLAAHWDAEDDVNLLVDHLNAIGYGEGRVRFDVYVIGVLNDADRDRHPNAAWLAGKSWPKAVTILVDNDADDVFNTFAITTVPGWVYVYPEGSVAGRRDSTLPTAEFDAMGALLSATIP